MAEAGSGPGLQAPETTAVTTSVGCLWPPDSKAAPVISSPPSSHSPCHQTGQCEQDTGDVVVVSQLWLCGRGQYPKRENKNIGGSLEDH